MKLFVNNFPEPPMLDVKFSVVADGRQINLIAEATDGRKGIVAFFIPLENGKIQCESVCYEAHRKEPSIGDLLVLDKNHWVEFRK